MKHEFAPAYLDVQAFAQSSGELAGEESLARYARILQECEGRGADLVVAWSARGETRVDQLQAEQVWLHLHAEVVAPLTCQRCLEVVDITLRVDRSFRFVADEQIAAAQDDDSEEDLLVLSGEFNLRELIEDELVLELPMIAHHDICPGPLSTTVTDAKFGIAVAGRPNPFAVLARLKPSNKGDTR